MNRILIVGATSAIAEATARRWARDGDRLFLVGRREDRLRAITEDLELRGAEAVHRFVLDINDLDAHEAMLSAAVDVLGGLDIVLVAHGTLPDQARCEDSPALAIEEFRTNALATIALLTRLANVMEEQASGRIAVITSVAADRGRQSNYVYGAAKAMVDVFLEGMRQRLHKSGVGVTTIRPGFVDTPMTAAFDKGILWTTPDAAARRIQNAIRRGADIAYVPPFWRIVMLVIRSIPRPVYKRIRL